MALVANEFPVAQLVEHPTGNRKAGAPSRELTHSGFFSSSHLNQKVFLFTLSTLLILAYAGRLSHMNLANGLGRQQVLCSSVGRASDRQSELAGVRIFMGDSDVFFVLRSRQMNLT